MAEASSTEPDSVLGVDDAVRPVNELDAVVERTQVTGLTTSTVVVREARGQLEGRPGPSRVASA